MHSPIRGIPKIGDVKWIDDRNKQNFVYQRTPLDWTPAAISDYSTAVVSWYDASWANTILFTNAPGILSANCVYRWMSRGPNANDYLYSTSAGDYIANTAAANSYYAQYDTTTESMTSIHVTGFNIGTGNTSMASKTGTGFSSMPAADFTIVCQSAADYSTGSSVNDGGVPTRIPVHVGWANANATQRAATSNAYGRFISSMQNANAAYSTTVSSTTTREPGYWSSTNSINSFVSGLSPGLNSDWVSNTTVATSVVSANTTYAYMSVNGNTAGGFVATGLTAMTNTGPLCLSSDITIGASASRNVPGWFQEVIVFNRMLTLTELQQVEGYLAWKWGTQSKLPSTHPYYSSKPKIAGAS